jgi:hypothetical protein
MNLPLYLWLVDDSGRQYRQDRTGSTVYIPLPYIRAPKFFAIEILPAHRYKYCENHSSIWNICTVRQRKKSAVEFCRFSLLGYTAVYESQPMFWSNMSSPHSVSTRPPTFRTWQVQRGTSDISIPDPTVTWTEYIQIIPTIPKGCRIIGQAR